MRSLFQMIRRTFRYRLLTVFAVICALGGCVCKLWLPKIMEDIVDKGVYGSDMELVFRLGGLLLAICIFMGAFSYGVNLLCTVIGQRFALTLRNDLYNRIMSLPLCVVERFGSGTLITRLTQDVDSCSGLSRAVLLLAVEPFLMMAGGIIAMWMIAPSFGLVFACFVLLQMFIIILFVKSTAPMFLKVRRVIDKMNSRMQNLFINFRLIKAFNTEKKSEEEFSSVNNSLFDTAYGARKKIALFNPVIMLIMNLAVAVILYLSGVRVEAGSLNVGTVFAAVTYAEQILVSMVAGGRIFQVIAETKPGAERICEILDTESEENRDYDSIHDSFDSLSFVNVCYEYPEGGTALKNIDFSISAGDFVAVIGMTGSGKSTLAGLCAGLYDATSGQVLLNDKDIRERSQDDVRRLVALTEKQSAVLEGTLLENIMFGRENITSDDAERAISDAELSSYVQNVGPDSYVPSMGRGLSGGERQRLVIARALAGRPGLLILDDSTSSLDYQTENTVLNNLRKSYPSMAILLITHRIAEAAAADRILILDRGELVAEGTDEQLISDCIFYRRLRESRDSEEVQLS